jgi:hypothetical protein
MSTLGTMAISFIGRLSMVTPTQALNSTEFSMLYYPVDAPFFLRSKRVPRRQHRRQLFLRPQTEIQTNKTHTHTHAQLDTNGSHGNQGIECEPHRQRTRQQKCLHWQTWCRSLNHSLTPITDFNRSFTSAVSNFILILSADQHSETNVIYFLFNLLRIKDHYIFRALFVHP